MIPARARRAFRPYVIIDVSMLMKYQAYCLQFVASLVNIQSWFSAAVIWPPSETVLADAADATDVLRGPWQER
jgi:hypothetical protein